nr:BrnT family toxin [uncultured Halomonas sp.]
MQLEYDAQKAANTLNEPGIDFSRAADVFAGDTLDRIDSRHDYGEERIITAGRLDGRIVLIVWTPRGSVRRIISMRKANEREIARLEKHLGRS